MDASARFLARPYEDRQFLVIADEVAGPPSQSGLLGAVKSVANSTLGGVLLGMPTVALIEWAVRKSQRAADEGLDIEVVTRADIQSLLFPPGHPRRKVVYAGHPFQRTQYIPLGSFHRVLFEQKVIEATELLAALGATSIQIRQVAGTKSSAAIAASVGIPVQGANVGIEADLGSRQEEKGDILQAATLIPTRQPYVPAGMIWYQYERFWQGLAKMRLENGLIAYSLEVNYEEDYGVNAKISAKIQDVGFGIGGTFTSFESTRWVMQGEFAPLDSLRQASAERAADEK